MRVLTKEECELENGYLSEKISRGAIFIYPTDTIYGIGCNALRPEAVQKIRQLKNRYENPFSVIAPSKDWITENCKVDEETAKIISNIPEAVTMILKLKNNECIAHEVNNGLETLGVRRPSHWFTDFVSWLKVPIVTTSVNKAGEDFMTSLEDLDTDIKSSVDFIVYEGEKKGRPSKIIDTTKGEVIER